MKKLIKGRKVTKVVTETPDKIEEVDNEGLMALMGKQVLLFCDTYIYTGTLMGVNTTSVLLETPSIVYATGAFGNAKFDDAQKLNFSHYVQVCKIESFCETDKK